MYRRFSPHAVFALLVLAALKRIEDFDIWFDLVIGRKILEGFQIPQSEFYVYTLLGEPAVFPEWGFGVLFYLAYLLFEYAGMGILHALIVACALFAFYRAADTERRYEPLALGLLCALFMAVYHRMVYRPEISLYLCLGCAIYVLEAYQADGRWRRLVIIPVVALALGWFHPSVFILLIVGALYVAQIAWAAFLGGGTTSASARQLFLFLIAAALASLLNPYGALHFTLLFDYAGNEDLLGGIAEYAPTLETTHRWLFLGIGAISLGGLIARGKRAAVDWLTFLVFGYLALRYVRNVPLFALMMYVPTVKAYRHLFDKRPLFSGRWFRRFLRASASIAFVVAVAFVVRQGKWGLGVIDQWLPDEAVKVIRTVKPPGKIFNHYETGGYLAWELYGEYRVFIDGRIYEANQPYRVHNRIVFDGDPQWKARFDGYGVNIVVIRATRRFTGQLSPLASWIAEDEEWILSSIEPWYYLFLRKSTVEHLDNVPNLDRRLLWRNVLEEAEAIAARFQDGGSIQLTRGVAFFKLGEWASAREAFSSYLESNPGDSEVREVLAWIDDLER